MELSFIKKGVQKAGGTHMSLRKQGTASRSQVLFTIYTIAEITSQ